MTYDCSIWVGLFLGFTFTASACGDGRNATLTNDDLAKLRTMTLVEASLPASPTNAHADDPAAALLGRALFFDERMSADGKISCGSCHDPAKGFSDSRPVSLGVAGRAGARHSMPVTAVALHPFLFWDGRADSVWSQPLKAIEGQKEMDFTRVEVVRFLAAQHRDAYESVFGALPDPATLPMRAAPGLPAWDAMSADQQDRVNRVFSNAGKAIEAYERKVICSDTRFDRFVRGELTLTATEVAGAADFVQSGCTGCHDGPSFSDGKFHNLGLGDGSDSGRAGGLKKLFADPFNGAGAYSDDTAAGSKLLAAAAQETRTQGSFRTASLRGAGQRTAFGHLGDRSTLNEFIRDAYDRGRGGRGRNGGNDGDNNLDPLLDGVDPGNIDNLVAFLHTLDCPTLDATLLAP